MNKHIKNEYAWPVLVLATGFIIGLVLIANRNFNTEINSISPLAISSWAIEEGVGALAVSAGAQKVRINGDFTVSTSGAVVRDQNIEVTGSVVIAADDVTLKNVSIKCVNPGNRAPHNVDGVRAIGVNRLTLRHVTVTGCGGNGIFLQNGSGHDLAEGQVTLVKGLGVVFDNVSQSILIGWYLRSGVDIRNGSHHNRVVSVLVQGNQAGYPYHISADSYANQIVRSRSRDNVKTARASFSENPDNLWHHVICDEVKGYAACYLTWNRKGPNDHGDPAAYSPRTWTVCLPPSFGGNKCDYESYDNAVADPAFKDGDIVLIDSKAQKPWAPIIISRPLWLVGNLRSQKGTYSPSMIEVGRGFGGPGITVQSSGVRLQDLHIDLPPVRETDTEIIDVKVYNKNRWIYLE